MFIHVAKEDETIVADLGILFHSKEFPEEFGNSTGRYPIGCPGILLFFRLQKIIIEYIEAGGNIKDPRIGTKCSVKHPDYHIRNYLWLLSNNSIIILDLLVCFVSLLRVRNEM